jgi:hypothetical protein
MLALPPSLQHRHTVVWSRDPALGRPKDDDAAALKAWEAAFADARDRGRYEALIGDSEPTRFEVKPLAGSVARRMLDELAARRLGEQEFASLTFRICICSIANPEIEVKRVPDSRFGAIAELDLVDLLDAINPGIVNEIGTYLFQRAASPSGK